MAQPTHIDINSLSMEEYEALGLMVESGQSRFTVARAGRDYVLVEKGMLRVIDAANPDQMICEIAPAVEAKRVMILEGLAGLRMRGFSV